MPVLYERAGKIAYVTLSRPGKLNALDEEMYEAYENALRRFDLDDDAWVAIVSGEGRAFCSGADVKTRQQLPADELRRRGSIAGPYGRQIWEIVCRSVNYKPVLAAVHGYALGAGLAIVLASDLIVADSTASFQVTEAQRGLSTLPFLAALRQRGLGASALDVCLTGRTFSAREALSWDLINRVTGPGGHLDEAGELAEVLLRLPPLGIRSTVRRRRQDLWRAVSEARYEADALKLHLTEDFRRSGQAFLDKKELPAFEGR